MKLQLRYSHQPQQRVNAVCLRGENASTWLKEIGTWQIPVHKLRCFILPQSIRNVAPAALFVVFDNPQLARELTLLEPYTAVIPGFFIPINTVLFPEITKEELSAHQRWPYMVYHPVIGVTGFEDKDVAELSSLFFCGDSSGADWSYANPGIMPKPLFHAISLQQPTVEELLNEIQKNIGHKSLFDIPEKDKPTAAEKIVDTVKHHLFKALQNALNRITTLLTGDNAYGNVSKESWLDKTNRWLQENIDDIEKKRKDEINRLLNMFDDDTDEALQYAIPLDSPYLNRGTPGRSGATLIKNPVNFNLGRLGGGKVVDSWDIGDRYNDLRSKYMAAAQREIDKNDCKKAAYIYAHLLGDYAAAANVLEQGKQYREAAIIWKDHLKNIPAAAECLERGALYNEAIDLYKDMNRTEKIGDLYGLMDDHNNAAVYYEKHITSKLSDNDYIDAARVIDEKLASPGRAKEVLLRGWQHAYQYEQCLKKYFDIAMQTQKEATAVMAQKLFSDGIPPHKKLSFLNVMDGVNQQLNDPSFADAAREIAFDIVHAEAEEGNLPALHQLKKFIPDDKLIAADTSRYVNNNRSMAASKKQGTFFIDKEISWIKAIWHLSQFLAIGIKNETLYLVRGNWYQNLEYYSWERAVGGIANLTFISSPFYSDHVILHASDGVPVTRKTLPKNKYFSSKLIVNCPVWLHKGAAQFIIDEQQQIVKFEMKPGSATLHYYDIEGALKKSVNCTFNDETILSTAWSMFPFLAKRGDYYYSYRDKYLLAVDQSGNGVSYGLDTLIRFVAVSAESMTVRMIVSTNKGCLLFKPEKQKFNLQEDFFATDLTPSAITFINDQFFAITEKLKVAVFEISDNTVTQKGNFVSGNPVVAILPGTISDEFAVLENNGKISFFDVHHL